MSEETINDLKHFIATTIDRAVAGLATRQEMDKRFDQVSIRFQQMDFRFDDLDLKVDTIADAHAIMLEDHDLAIDHLQAIR